jgi:hypothetical protein
MYMLYSIYLLEYSCFLGSKNVVITFQFALTGLQRVNAPRARCTRETRQTDDRQAHKLSDTQRPRAAHAYAAAKTEDRQQTDRRQSNKQTDRPTACAANGNGQADEPKDRHNRVRLRSDQLWGRAGNIMVSSPFQLVPHSLCMLLSFLYENT